jgi:hypothetical protein
LVCITLVWREIAPRAPASPSDPNDPAYDWHAFDPVMNGLRAHRITRPIEAVRAGRYML